jgi:hypothetical protein
MQIRLVAIYGILIHAPVSSISIVATRYVREGCGIALSIEIKYFKQDIAGSMLISDVRPSLSSMPHRVILAAVAIVCRRTHLEQSISELLICERTSIDESPGSGEK